MDQKTKEIQLSISFNNASRIVAGVIGSIPGDINPEEVANSVEQLARELYTRQIKFLEEINQPKDE